MRFVRPSSDRSERHLLETCYSLESQMNYCMYFASSQPVILNVQFSTTRLQMCRRDGFVGKRTVVKQRKKRGNKLSTFSQYNKQNKGMRATISKPNGSTHGNPKAALQWSKHQGQYPLQRSTHENNAVGLNRTCCGTLQQPAWSRKKMGRMSQRTSIQQCVSTFYLRQHKWFEGISCVLILARALDPASISPKSICGVITAIITLSFHQEPPRGAAKAEKYPLPCQYYIRSKQKALMSGRRYTHTVHTGDNIRGSDTLKMVTRLFFTQQSDELCICCHHSLRTCQVCNIYQNLKTSAVRSRISSIPMFAIGAITLHTHVRHYYWGTKHTALVHSAQQ